MWAAVRANCPIYLCRHHNLVCYMQDSDSTETHTMALQYKRRYVFLFPIGAENADLHKLFPQVEKQNIIVIMLKDMAGTTFHTESLFYNSYRTKTHLRRSTECLCRPFSLHTLFTQPKICQHHVTHAVY